MARRSNVLPVAALTTVATVVAAAVALWPVLAFVLPDSASTAPDPVRITEYQADFTVDEDGTLTATETLTTEFPGGRHGIFRFWDVTAPYDDHTRLIPRDIEVTLDGRDEPFDLSWQNGRRYRVARIGQENVTLSPGRHVYEISYRIDGVLAPPSAGAGPPGSGSWSTGGEGSVFYYDVIPGGWQMVIDRALVTVSLPTPARDVKCAIGQGSTGGCAADGVGTDTIEIGTGTLWPRTPVTIRATQEIDQPDAVTVPWTPMFDGVLGQSLPLALAVGVVALAGLAIGRVWEWGAREPVPGYPVMYEPPTTRHGERLGPAQSYYVMHEHASPRALVATLLYQAERGLTTLTQVGDDWRIEGQGGDWNAVDPVTRSVGSALGVTTAGSAFLADGGVSSGKALDSAGDTAGAEVRAWARRSGLLVSRAQEHLGRVLVVVAAIVFLVLVFVRPGGITLWALPFAAFAVGGIGLLLRGVGTRRTAAGRDAWSRAGGFHRLLSTTSAEDRFDFSARKDLYTAYIPYAVAFECADRWAEKYRIATGEEAPAPVWYAAASSGGNRWRAGAVGAFAGFETSLRSSIGAYEATQRSSSSGGGGGGFSGGGGGGGGGGGSW